MISRLLGAAAAALLLATSALAQQPVVPGEPSRAAKALPAATLRLAATAQAQRVELPAVTEAELDAVRSANKRNTDAFKPTLARRLAIGVVRDPATVARALPSGPLAWREVPGGRAARLEVTSPEAAALRTAIDLSQVPVAVEMVFYGSADSARLEGPVRVADIADRTRPYWSPITEGDTQAIEFFAPAGVTLPEAAPRVSSASHLLSTPSSGFTKRLQDIGTSGSCNVDVVCNGTVQQVADSVAQMVFNDGALTALCTGQLLNDSDPASQVPWFYSANHCFENENPPYKTPAQMQVVANTLATIWGFQAATCHSLTPRSDWMQMSSGSTYIYSNAQSDALFLRLNGTPPAYAFFSGWDANTLSAGTAVTALHHPNGDLKKVSQGTVRGLPILADPGPGGGSFIEVVWTSGTTERGSSGGGLWTLSSTPGGAQYLFRGGLWGGTALCSNPAGTDNFSRFDLVYPSLAQYLGTAASAPGPTTDFTDLWWGGASEDGWGLNLVQHPSKQVFGVWYTYDASGKRTWFAFTDGAWTAQDTYEAPLVAVTGPPQSGPFDASQVQRNVVGSVTLSFSDASHGTFRWNIGGDTRTKSITRLAF